MERLLEEDGVVFIKTYCFESGLWYLAKQLGMLLEEQGHKVYYIPKSKYRLTGLSYDRTYPAPSVLEDFKDEKILKLDGTKSIHSQLGALIVKYKAKYIISFETLMQKAGWVSFLKSRFRNDIKIIDVPMAEWIENDYLKGGSYGVFDAIWSLNELTKDIFKNYNTVKDVSWPLVDKRLFNKKNRKRKLEPIKFLHLASINPDYSTKSTSSVLRAFENFNLKYKPEVLCELEIRGCVSKSDKFIIEKHTNISYNSEILSRLDLAKKYKMSDCIIAPSSREGLSLSLYEGLASGCKIITTDAAPMNYIDTPYLCDVTHIRTDRSLVSFSIIDEQSLYNNLIKVYEDLKNGK